MRRRRAVAIRQKGALPIWKLGIFVWLGAFQTVSAAHFWNTSRAEVDTRAGTVRPLPGAPSAQTASALIGTGDLQTATKGHGRGHGRGNGRGRGKGNHGQSQTEVLGNTSTPILVPAQITPSAQAATAIPQGSSMQGAETPNTPAAAITATLEVYTISAGVVPQIPTPILTLTEGTETIVVGFGVLGDSSVGMSSAAVVASSAAVSPATVEASSSAAVVTSSPAVLPDDDYGDCEENSGEASPAAVGASSVAMTPAAVATSSAAVSTQNYGASSTAVASPAAAAASSPAVSPPLLGASSVPAVPAASAAVVPGTDPSACDCSCLCPYDFFNQPAVNIPMGSPGVTPQALPTTFSTVVTPASMSVGVGTSSNPPTAVSSVAAPQAITVAASSSIGAQSSRSVVIQSSNSVRAQPLSSIAVLSSSSTAALSSSSIAAQLSSSAMVQASSSIASSTVVNSPPAATTVTPAADEAPFSAESSSDTPTTSSLAAAAAVTTPPEPAATTSSTSETAAETTDPSADAEAAPIDINTVSLHSALTIRLGGRDVEPEPTAS